MKYSKVFSPALHPVWILKVKKRFFLLFLERRWKTYWLKVNCASDDSQWMVAYETSSVQLQECNYWSKIMCPSYVCPFSPSSGTQRELKHKWIAPFIKRNVTHRGSWGKRRGEQFQEKYHVFTTNQTVAMERIHTVAIEQLRFLSYNCWLTSFFVIELGYFNVSILTCCSFKNFKRGTVSQYRL